MVVSQWSWHDGFDSMATSSFECTFLKHAVSPSMFENFVDAEGVERSVRLGIKGEIASAAHS